MPPRRCKVWEVARATSAAFTFFDPIKLGRDNIEFIDASYGYNNPCEVLVSEAEKLLPGREMIILSIGTGLGDAIEIKDSQHSVVEALSKMAVSSRSTDQRIKTRYNKIGMYHRFNVDVGLRDAATLGCFELSTISAHTINYLHGNGESVTRFVKALATGSVSYPTVCHDEKDKECLRDLYVTDPRTDKKNIEERKGGLMKDCYRWIVEHKDFQQFLQEEESRILWIKGHPGKGKTMLLCGIINELELQRPVPPLSYFFCQAANDQLNTATSVLRGLIYDLANQNPQLTKHVRKKYDVAGNKLFSNGSLWNDLCDILTNMLNDPSLRNAILIVDALDECSKSRQKLLEFISKPSPAKWIVSSRNWPEIEEVLSDADQKVTIHLEINQDSVSAAVDSYIKWGVDRLVKRKKYDDDTKMVMLKIKRRKIYKKLLKTLNGSFSFMGEVLRLHRCRFMSPL
ncbi:Vegetative incompatibility protein HET-E-1 [Ceratocystis platani]|uniref:Vegetative incompatibility protein HET-E-1 n=1 Tax=Ceratocystis fimbriata f. sp. platani TaxID=88771 RepID=A0A0F8B3A4_CERFI|nr:Vegetative incompatibility protein HET-E-1 [Ceratocystis platani]